MNEPTTLTASDLKDQPFVPPATGQPRSDVLAWLCGFGFLVLCAAIALVWLFPSQPVPVQTAIGQLHALQQQVADDDGRLDRLEQKPVAAPAADLARLDGRLTALEKHTDNTEVSSRLDVVSGRIEALSGRLQTGEDAAKQQIDALAARITALEKPGNNLNSVTERLNRVVRLQEAGLALNAGKPVGDVPNAPAALARFAHAAPPTEAQLRLSFPGAEQAALAAPQVENEQAPFANRVWERAQDLMTVRRGGDIVVGNPASLPLAKARQALEAGDLPAAVAAVKILTGPPLQAMDGWLGQATALLAARAALADMSGQV